MTTAVTALLALRDSTDKQDVARQREAGHAYAAAHGLTIIHEIVDYISGTVPIFDRPGGREILDWIAGRRADALIFDSISRVAREEHPVSAPMLRSALAHAGMQLHYVDKGRADLSPYGGIIDYIGAPSTRCTCRISGGNRRGNMPTLSNSDPKSYELRPMGDAEMDEINRRYRFAVAQSTDQFQPQDFDYMDSIRKSLDEFAPTWRAMAAWRPPPVDIAFIGDLHGNMKDWLKLRRSFKRTIQVGDLGAGFAELPPEENGHTWIRGNHDSPDIACTRGDYLGDFGMRDGVFFVSGAASIDRDQRTPGVDWWADEELSDAQMHEALKLYAETRPSLVVSHCAPREAELVIGSSWRGCRTSYWLQRMLDLHRPRLWVFGHYHEKHDKTVDGTRFLCVPKNQVLLVEYPR